MANCKIIFPLVYLLVTLNNQVYCQNEFKIDSSNYYDFYKKRESVFWLEPDVAIEIIESELRRIGFFDNQKSVLYKVDSLSFVVLELYNLDKSIGFIYREVHQYPPNRDSRYYNNTYLRRTGFEQVQRIYTDSGSYDLKIRKMPRNIFIIEQDSYWYQEGVSTNTVTKRVISDIFRKDVRGKISAFLEGKK